MKAFFVLIFCAVALHLYALDPEHMALDETRVWQDYYAKDANKEIANLTNIFENQFNISNRTAAEGVAYKFGIAMVTFKEMPLDSNQSQYNARVLPLLTDAYEHLRHIVSGSWNSKEAAQADMDWWIARRNPQTNNPWVVGKKMEHLYVVLFGNHDHGHFGRAAYLRAQAAFYRDLCEKEWHGITKGDWVTINSMLESAYTELQEGIVANKTHLVNSEK